MGVYDVKTKEIIVCGQRFIIRQATTDDAARRALLVNEMYNKWQSLLPDTDAKEITIDESNMDFYANRYLETTIWPSLLYCTKSLDAELPTLDELHRMPDADKELWVAAVAELNPSYFPAELTEEEQKASIEKKS